MYDAIRPPHIHAFKGLGGFFALDSLVIEKHIKQIGNSKEEDREDAR